MATESKQNTLLSQFKFNSQLVVSNPSFQSTNWKNRDNQENLLTLKNDASNLPSEHDTLVISFNLDVYSGIHNPEFSGDDETILERYQKEVLDFICNCGYFSGFDILGYEISKNIVDAYFINEFLDEFSDVEMHIKLLDDLKRRKPFDDTSDFIFQLGKLPENFEQLKSELDGLFECTFAGCYWRNVYVYGIEDSKIEYAQTNLKITTYIHIGNGKPIYISACPTVESQIKHITNQLYKLNPKSIDGFEPKEDLFIEPLNFYRNNEEFCRFFECFVYGLEYKTTNRKADSNTGLIKTEFSDVDELASNIIDTFLSGSLKPITRPITEHMDYLMFALIRGDE